MPVNQPTAQQQAGGVARAALPALVALACVVGSADAAPVPTPWSLANADRTSALAAAAVSGVTAASDTLEDSVEVRWSDGTLRATITRARFAALLPWTTLDDSPDGPAAVALTDSGRLLFIAVADASPASDGLPSDAILRYDTDTDALQVFARVELSTSDAAPVAAALAHFRGRLYAGTASALMTYRATANDAAGTLLGLTPTAGPVAALAVDRDRGLLFHTVGRTLSRSPVSTLPLAPTVVGDLPADVVGLAHAPHYGAAANAGLYALDSGGDPAIYRLWFVPPTQALGQQALAPTLHFAGLGLWRGLAATCDGGLLAGSGEDAAFIRESADPRLSFSAWADDEFSQHVRLVKGLITRGPGAGGPAGWVIDAEAALGSTRLHPASPDAAAWAVLMLMMSEHVRGDAEAHGLVRTILDRYAGLAPDGIRPLRNADGIYWHWIEPATGGAKAGWGDAYSTMSTMKLGLAAARARAFYADDPAIRAAADAILCSIDRWDTYFDPAARMALLGNAAGVDATSFSTGWHEGVLFAEQAGIYGSSTGPLARSRWISRDGWPLAAAITGRTVTTSAWGLYQPAFITMYPALLVPAFRDQAAWRQHSANLRASHAAWTDDQAPRTHTVFSAGTTKAEWGGYHADSLTDHPGDVSTYSMLLASAAAEGPARAPELYAAYHAYRVGARQAFAGGASLLYRRSALDWAYLPNTAGLPDLTVGGLALGEWLRPGALADVLHAPYPRCGPCPADFNADGFVDFFDFNDFVACFEDAPCPPGATADFNADGFVDFFDLDEFVAAFEAGC